MISIDVKLLSVSKFTWEYKLIYFQYNIKRELFLQQIISSSFFLFVYLLFGLQTTKDLQWLTSGTACAHTLGEE